MTPRCHCSPDTTSALCEPTSGFFSTSRLALKNRSLSSFRRLMFSTSSCCANASASVSSAFPLAKSNCTAISGVAIRPAAFNRGAIPKETKKLSTVLFLAPATSSRACNPTACCPFDSSSKPALAIILFSPTKGTTSANVPIAAIFKNPFNQFFRPLRSPKA